MKVLLAVVSCQHNKGRVESQRATWMGDVPPDAPFELVVFEGGGIEDQTSEWHEHVLDGVDLKTITLDVGDGYCELPDKVRAIYQWALDNDYDGVWRIDDDVYLRPDRLFVPPAHYAGRVRGPAMNLPAPYCSGFCYYLSRKAMQLVVDTPLKCVAEDCMVGNILHGHGIQPMDLGRCIVVATSNRSVVSSPEGPHQGNSIMASCEYKTLEEMRQAHADFNKPPAPKFQFPADPELNKVDLLIKTFLRDGMLFRTLGDLKDNAKGIRLVIVDDSDNHSLLKTQVLEQQRQKGHAVHLMPFDSGFGAKSNAAIPLYERPYVLIGSDDFSFTPKAVEGIRQLVRFLDDHPEYGIVSGRVDGKPYEFMLEREGTTIREVKALPNEHGWIDCDLTVNYSLIRRELLGPHGLHWHDDVKIGGGEHADFFLTAKELGIRVACLPDVNIDQMHHFTGAQDRRYPGFRGRARQPGRVCLRRRGITHYWCFGHAEPEVC